jgi:hypothetical protein
MTLALMGASDARRRDAGRTLVVRLLREHPAAKLCPALRGGLITDAMQRFGDRIVSGTTFPAMFRRLKSPRDESTAADRSNLIRRLVRPTLPDCEDTMVPLLNSALVTTYEFERRRQRLREQALPTSSGTSPARGRPRCGPLGFFAARPVAVHSHRSGTTDSAAVRRP